MSADRVPAQVFYGHVSRGKLHLVDRPAFDRHAMDFEDSEVELRLQKRKKDRTSAQNKYYWKVVVAYIAEETGDSKEAVHEGLKHRFLIDRDDKMLPRVRSTTSLTTSEMARYIDDCVQLAAEYRIVIPDPQY
jgi:hypothetical protein